VLLRVESLAEEGKVRLPAQRHSRCRSCCQRAVHSQLLRAVATGNRLTPLSPALLPLLPADLNGPPASQTASELIRFKKPLSV
jgi:hypothetical protein